jgi:hypothetical protein
MTDFREPFVLTSSPAHAQQVSFFGRPDDVLKDRRLTPDQKRCLLASWASDANAVPHLPALRQLPDGSIVRVDEILDALKALDGAAEAGPRKAGHSLNWGQSIQRRLKARPRVWKRYGRWPWDDDDDPPPCPAFAALRPREGGGAGAVEPELALA